MPFVSKVISENETLLAIGRVHWIHLVKGLMWLLTPLFVWSVMIELLTRHVYNVVPTPLSDAIHIMLYYMFCAFLFMGAIMFILAAVHFLFTEMALTTKRVIYKTGWIFVRMRELDLEEIKAADVDNGWFGRFLNYGHLILDSRFVGSMDLISIAHPYGFLRVLNNVRGKLKQDSVNVILEGRESITAKDSPAPDAAAVPKPPPPTFQSIKRLHDKILQSFSMSNKKV